MHFKNKIVTKTIHQSPLNPHPTDPLKDPTVPPPQGTGNVGFKINYWKPSKNCMKYWFAQGSGEDEQRECEESSDRGS